MFDVVVFLACRTARPEGPRGAGASFRLPFTLEGVSYVYNFGDPSIEPPAVLGELCFYTRFFRRRGTAQTTRRFGLRIYACNDDGSQVRVAYPSGATTAAPFDLGRVPFPASQPVVSWAFVVRDLVLPRRGRYEFQLLVRRRKHRWQRPQWFHVASNHIIVE